MPIYVFSKFKIGNQMVNLSNIDIDMLNITKRERASLFSWKGQFSPQMVEYILNFAFKNSRVIYDPFCGSGTVLFESSKLGKESFGSELNPAAWCLNSTIMLNSLNKEEILTLKNNLNQIYLKYDNIDCMIDLVKGMERGNEKSSLTAILLLATGNSKHTTAKSFNKNFTYFLDFLDKLPCYKAKSISYLEDCRNTSIESNTIDGVITSPPYINVFNYHQNYRSIMEKLGWSPLSVAKSEFGANRKFRQNRFLTVLQYSQDMAQTLNTLNRVMKKDALGVMIVGRESQILGESISNSCLLKELISSHEGFDLQQNCSRNYKNRFGKTIVEDLIFFKKNRDSQELLGSNARSIAINILLEALKRAKQENILLINDCINKAEFIESSSIYIN